VDGKEILDPFNDDSTDNGQGGYNSRIIIGKPDMQTPFIYGSSFADGEIRIKYDQALDGIEAFWENYRIPGSMIRNGDQEIIISIPDEAGTIKRSHIRIWGYNKNGLSNDMLVPLENGRVITDAASLDRTDQHTYRMYFLMVDRFFNGRQDNDKKVDDPQIKPLANYLGGDIAGVEKKLQEGYFDSLGMNTVWLSPIGLNPEGAWGWWDKGGVQSKFSGYHGYWPAQSKAVDYRFGTKDELRSLIESAHSNDKNILLDYVANHVHKEHPVYQQNPDWATELYLPDGTLNTEKWDEHRLTTWFDTFLPTLDLENPEVTEAMSDSAIYWFENFEIDGFRHDATKHIPEIFWRTLTRKLKTRVMLPENRSIYQIGETYGNAELIGSYVSTGQLDAQFDFNVYDRAISVLTNEENRMLDLAAQLKESLKFYGYHNLMGYISGNQDRPRFISLADGSVDPAIDTKLQGWTKTIDNNGEIGYKRLAQLHAFNFTIPGIPVIYYGDEIGMPGGNDPDNRRMMIFDDLNQDQLKMKEIVSKLAQLRSQNMALLYGDLRIIDVDEFTLTFERRYFNEKVVVILNNVSKQKNFAIPDAAQLNPVFSSKKTEGSGHAVVSVEPHGFEILAN
jgi:glycosidase